VYQDNAVLDGKILQQLSLSRSEVAECQLLDGDPHEKGGEDRGAKAQSSEGFEEKRRQEISLRIL
jgi:hypothetical protein